MPARIPLDGPLAGRPFRVRDGLASGWGEGRLRGGDLARPFHGVRNAGQSGPEQEYAPLLRDRERFSHVSAARLWGVPLPRTGDEVHVSRPPGSRARSRGVIGHRSIHGGFVIRRGLPVSDPAATFLELATLLSVPDLVAVGDHLVLDPRVLEPDDPRPLLALGELRDRCASERGRGVRTARAAAELVREGAESRKETQLRLLAREAGLPEPELGRPLFGTGGHFIGYFDLTWPGARLIAEYDGDQHRTSTSQYERDIRRFDEAADAGHRVIRVRSRGLGRDRATTVRRLREAFAASTASM